MELTFLGRGAMLYPQEGNTAAYFEEGNNLFLFDCGEDVAAKLIKDGKLTKDSEVYLFITHTHSDHIGSLGSLQQYLYWVCGKKLNIVYDFNIEYMKEIKGILRGFGLEPNTYRMILERDLDDKFESFSQIRYMESNHGDIPLSSSSIIISFSGRFVWRLIYNVFLCKYLLLFSSAFNIICFSVSSVFSKSTSFIKLLKNK